MSASAPPPKNGLKNCDHKTEKPDPCPCDLKQAIEQTKASGDKEQAAAARVAKATDRVSAAKPDSKKFRLPMARRK